MFFSIFLCCVTHLFHNVCSTEITTASTIIDNSLGIDIELPVLVCHPRHSGYSKVTWYKDFIMVKSGRSDLSGHILSLDSLLYSSLLKEEFDNPLKLQGYYWCVTDRTELSNVFDFLFRIEEVHTFVGRFVAKKDSLSGTKIFTQEEMINLKKKLYEEQLETTLFGFLQSPSVYVTDLKVLSEGLDVRFFIYVRPAFHPRKPIDEKLVMDQDHLEYVRDYLNNESVAVDPIMYLTVRNWTDLLGIDIQQIDLRSTLGCYEEVSIIAPDINETVVWPYARIGDVVIPDNACSSKNGISVTRICTGSFFTGAKWGNPSGKCEKPAEGITLQLNNLYNEFGNVKREHTIQELVAVTEPSSNLRITDLHITTEILKELSLKPKLNSKEITGILLTIDNIIETNKTELVAAKNIIHLTSRILRVFDNIMEQATEDQKEIQIATRHLMLDTKFTKTNDEKDPILGLAVIAPSLSESLNNGSIEFVTSKTLLPQHKSLAYFALPKEFILQRESDMDNLSLPCEVNMVFFKEWDLFQNPKGVLLKRNYKVLPTPVMYVSVSGGPAWNLTDPVHLYFKDTLGNKIEDPVCVYYDPRLEDGTGAWSSEGCDYEGYKNGYYHCQCHHLSIFAVILSENPDLGPSLKEMKLGTSVYVACGVSILALSLAVILFVMSKIWRQTVDHSILFSLSLCFLVSIIIIFISETHFARKPGCIVLALVFHYTIFTIFGWLLVQAFIYRLRFAKKTDVGEIPYFMIKTGLAIWGIPIIIIVIMWFSREYPCCEKHNCWLTVTEVSKEAVIPMAVLILITLCVYGCATYALTCRFKKDFLIGDLSSYNDVVVKYRVAFTIFLFFVFTWLFGFLALHRRTQTLRILFSIFMTLTAYYLSLFFIFQEVSLWDLCTKCKQNKVEPEDTPPVQYQAKSYQSVDDSNRTEK